MALSTNRAERNEDKSLPTLVTELRDLVVGYLKQETVDRPWGPERYGW